jgi:hypothetical protein
MAEELLDGTESLPDDADSGYRAPTRSDRAERARARDRVRNRRIALAACIVVVLGVFLHSAWSYRKSLDPKPNGTDFQNLISDAFLHGQLNLRLEVPDFMRKLKDPYDPVANFEARKNDGLHDLSYYKGKLYAFYGPAPALLLFIPYRLLHVGDLSPTLACLIFCIAGFAFSLLLFQLLVRRFFGSIPIWMECAAAIALGLAVPAAFIIYVGRGYEVSIACGYAMVFIGLYFLARGLWSGPRPRLPSLAIGSLFLAGAVASRPNYLVAGVFLVGAALLLYQRDRVERFEHPVRIAVALIGPYVAVGVLLALYNYARFGSVSEFGASYQLSGFNARTYPFNQLWYVPHGLYFLLLAPARFAGSFPFVFLRKSTLNPLTVLKAYQNEPVAGILTSMPVITVGLVLAFVSIPQFVRRRRQLGILTLLFAAVPIVVIVVTTYALRGTTMRYTLDTAPLLLFAGLLGWLTWSGRFHDRKGIFWTVQAVWVLALVGSVLFNLAITATPCSTTGTC